MKFHRQEHLVIRDEHGAIIQGGSCYPTVIACLLDLELHHVPYFHLLYFSEKGRQANLKRYFRDRYLGGKDPGDDGIEPYQKENYERAHSVSGSLWGTVFEYWLASIGYREMYITDIDQWLKDNPGRPYTVSGKSSRGVDHIVIYQDGKLLHDPHPSNEGLIELWEPERAFTFLEPICR